MRILLIAMLLGAGLYALEPGKHYDFLQKNGQNVLGAELVEESEKEYLVKLKYSPKPIRLHKENLAEPPALSKIQPALPKPPIKLKADFALNASFGFSYLTFGPIGKIFRTGYEARVGADWLLFEKPLFRIRALSVLTNFANYQSAARRIQLISIAAGPKFLIWHFSAIDASLFASPLIGLSYADLKGYTFTSSYMTLSATGLISFEKRWRNLAFATQLYVNSLFDSSLNFSSSGISVAVQYPLAASAPF